MKNASDFRLEARNALKNNLGWAILITLALIAIDSIAASISFGIALIVLAGALSVGVAAAFTGLFRKGRIDFMDLFSAFNNNFANAMVMGILMNVFVFLWSLLFIIPGIIATYSYAMAPYIQADNPEMSGTESITESKNLMKGKKWSLFCLHFSFIGWIILSMFTFGILFVAYVRPYITAADAAFYESIKHELLGGEKINSDPEYQPSNDATTGL